MKIVVTSGQGFTQEQSKRLNGLGDVTYFESQPDRDEYLKRAEGADVICSGTAGLKDAYTELKDVYLTVGFVSVAFLDLEIIAKNGVKVSNAPGINRHGVSEWIVFMLLSIGRDFSRFVDSDEDFRKNGNLPPNNPGLTDKNITILGNGNISKQLQRLVAALDMNITVFKRGDNLLNLIKDADYVVDVLAANSSTEGLLDTEFFNSMKKGSSFISVTRGEVMDEQALVKSLDSGHLHMAALDCGALLVGDTKDEYYIKLKNHPKIIATPHISYNSDKSFEFGNDVMIDNVEAWINNQPQNLLN